MTPVLILRPALQDEHGNTIRICALGRRRFRVVIAPDGQVIRMSYRNSVLGERPLHLDNVIAKRIARAVREAMLLA